MAVCVCEEGGGRGGLSDLAGWGGGIDTANTCPHVDQIWNIFGKILSFH